MITARRLQQSFADGLIREAVDDLWEPWMHHADKALQDEALLQVVQQELAKRYKKSKTRGRPGVTAEVVLRMLLLKHLSRLEFRGSDPRGTSQPGVSRIYAHRRRQSSG